MTNPGAIMMSPTDMFPTFIKLIVKEVGEQGFTHMHTHTHTAKLQGALRASSRGLA